MPSRVDLPSVLFARPLRHLSPGGVRRSIHPRHRRRRASVKICSRRERNPRLLLLNRFQIEGRVLLLATDAAAPLHKGHLDPSAFAGAAPSKESNLVRTSCIRFGRERLQIVRYLSRWDIEVALCSGCPSIYRKVISSGKRLRAHVGLDEGEGKDAIKVVLNAVLAEMCLPDAKYMTYVCHHGLKGAIVYLWQSSEPIKIHGEPTDDDNEAMQNAATECLRYLAGTMEIEFVLSVYLYVDLCLDWMLFFI